MTSNTQSEIDELIAQLVEVNNSRAQYYRTLASLFFTELTQEQIDQMAQADLAQMGASDETMARGYVDMERYLAKRNTGTREELAVDYAHVFLAAGNYETYAATPYESVFTSEAGLLMQEARDEVYKMYCDEHIQPDEALHVPEDHISFEFEFVATLLERMCADLAIGNFEAALYRAQSIQKFHREHQLNWVDDLCDAVMDCAKTRFYRGVSKITRGFVHAETEVIDDTVEVLGQARKELSAA